jgi:2-O-A-mannosyl-D-glycerate-specific PTS system IIC component
LAEVFRRESLGPTALGEGLAVPHGKSSAVNEAALRLLRCANRWSGRGGRP